MINVIKASIGISIVYAFYQLFLKNQHAFHLNRWFLISGLLITFLAPWVAINTPVNTSGYVLERQILLKQLIQQNPDYATIDHSINYLGITYTIGFIVLLMILLIRIVKFILYFYKANKIKFSGFYLVVDDTIKTPASFFHILFVPKEVYESSNFNVILIHEDYHKSNYHSIDVLLLEIMMVIQWFNPIMWLYKSAVQTQHEYAADRRVIGEGIDKSLYQGLLVERSTGYSMNDLMNYFNNSLLKARINMMNQFESNVKIKTTFLYVFASLFLLTLSMLPVQRVSAQKAKSIFTEVDKMPEYQGGIDAMYKVIAQKIRYPKQAKDNKIEGRVFISFVVNKDGEVTEVEVDKSEFKDNVAREIVVVGYTSEADSAGGDKLVLEEALALSAKNAVSQLGRFSPGIKSGKKVNVRITIPIMFKLS